MDLSTSGKEEEQASLQSPLQRSLLHAIIITQRLRTLTDHIPDMHNYKSTTQWDCCFQTNSCSMLHRLKQLNNTHALACTGILHKGRMLLCLVYGTTIRLSPKQIFDLQVLGNAKEADERGRLKTT